MISVKQILTISIFLISLINGLNMDNLYSEQVSLFQAENYDNADYLVDKYMEYFSNDIEYCPYGVEICGYGKEEVKDIFKAEIENVYSDEPKNVKYEYGGYEIIMEEESEYQNEILMKIKWKLSWIINNCQVN